MASPNKIRLSQAERKTMIRVAKQRTEEKVAELRRRGVKLSEANAVKRARLNYPWRPTYAFVPRSKGRSVSVRRCRYIRYEPFVDAQFQT